MRVLITGAQGYIGSRLIQLMNETNEFDVKGWDVGFFRGCTIESVGEIDRLIEKVDCREFDENKIAADAIVHLAAISNDPINQMDETTFYRPTFEYAARIAGIAKSKKIKFIFLSSCSVYGAAQPNELTEESETNPQTGYSRNKLEIEKYLSNIADEEFRPVALRFATVYGMSPRLRLDLFLNMFSAMAVSAGRIVLNSNGEAMRPSLHIDDGCRTILRFLKRNDLEKGLNLFNVGAEQDNMRIIDSARLVASHLPDVKLFFTEAGSSNEVLPEVFKDKKIIGGKDTRSYKVSFKKITEFFGGSPMQYNVETGIYELIEKMRTLKLDKSSVESGKYYRLQTLEQLVRKGIINDKLEMVTQ